MLPPLERQDCMCYDLSSSLAPTVSPLTVRLGRDLLMEEHFATPKAKLFHDISNNNGNISDKNDYTDSPRTKLSTTESSVGTSGSNIPGHGHGHGDETPSSTFVSLPERKNVRFGPTPSSEPITQVTYITHYTELDLEVQQQLWFTGQEMDQIYQDAARTVVAIKQASEFDHAPVNILSDDSPELTTRGLEYVSPLGIVTRTSSLEVVKLVLEEQQRQREEVHFKGILNDDLIAAIIGGVSRHRLRIAHLVAMTDARAVYGEGTIKEDPNKQYNITHAAGMGRSRQRKSKGLHVKRHSRLGRVLASGNVSVATETNR